jgi:hypothetical protein
LRAVLEVFFCFFITNFMEKLIFLDICWFISKLKIELKIIENWISKSKKILVPNFM